MGEHKRCAASGRALQVESAASERKRGKIHLRKTCQNQSKGMHKRLLVAMIRTRLSSNFVK